MQKGWRLFLELCLATKEDKLLSELFELLLTSEEIVSIETRSLIIKELLSQQYTQREMAEKLQVSIAKITRGSNELKRISARLRQFLLEQLKRQS